ncbi:MAG: hypothetical protein HGA54_07710 [Actinobacteria bacterium]|nr:hypothetical protein [Actinomycetota bacterium]
MITERENFIKMINREDPDFVPCQQTLLQMIIPSALGDRPAGHTTGYDWFGVHWSEDPDLPLRLAPTVGQKPILDDICDWEEVIKWPDLSIIDWEGCAKKNVPVKDPSKILCAMMVSGPFERLHDLLGFENALCATMTDPEECGAFFARVCDFKIEQIKYLKKYYDVDMVHFQDDWGSQKDLFFSPDFWREHIKPNIQRVIDAAHEEGVYFDMHSCGKIDRIVDEIVGMGVDVLDPVQPVNDMQRWIDDYNRKVIFMGALNAQEVIDNPASTDDAIRKEVEKKIDMFARDGYYVPFGQCLSPRIKDAINHGFMYGRTFYKPEEYQAEVDEFKQALAAEAASSGEPYVVFSVRLDA